MNRKLTRSRVTLAYRVIFHASLVLELEVCLATKRVTVTQLQIGQLINVACVYPYVYVRACTYYACCVVGPRASSSPHHARPGASHISPWSLLLQLDG